MKIIQARPEDVHEVKKIIDNLQVSRDQETWQEAPYGFFEHKVDEEFLMNARNPFFMVATNSADNVTGFALSYNKDFINTHYDYGRATDISAALKLVKGNYVYGDMLGVKNPDSVGGMRAAVGLIERSGDLARDNHIEQIVADVCEKPWTNNRSIRLIKRFGFKRFGEVNIGREIVLGAYILELR